jgi:hypothetical protein
MSRRRFSLPVNGFSGGGAGLGGVGSQGMSCDDFGAVAEVMDQSRLIVPSPD